MCDSKELATSPYDNLTGDDYLLELFCQPVDSSRPARSEVTISYSLEVPPEARAAYLSGYLAIRGYSPDDAAALTADEAEFLYEASTSGELTTEEVDGLIEASLQGRGTLPGVELQAA